MAFLLALISIHESIKNHSESKKTAGQKHLQCCKLKDCDPNIQMNIKPEEHRDLFPCNAYNKLSLMVMTDSSGHWGQTP